MTKLVFRNLEPSDLTRAFVEERLLQLTSKFPDLERAHFQLTIVLENSPRHPGPHSFTLKLHVLAGRYRGVRLEKSALHFYQAMAELMEAMLERLNRFGDRERVRKRQRERQLLCLSKLPQDSSSGDLGEEAFDSYEEERLAMP
jgi:ribosome-associated translation inhibitor RaiA